jgi:hypothetical protein
VVTKFLAHRNSSVRNARGGCARLRLFQGRDDLVKRAFIAGRDPVRLGKRKDVDEIFGLFPIPFMRVPTTLRGRW